MNKVTFDPNIPVEVALKFPDGRLVEGRFGDQMQYSLTDGRVMYIDLDVAEKVNQLAPRKGEPIVICKRSSGKKGAQPQWEVYRPGQDHVVRTPAPVAVADPTGIGESDIEAEVRMKKVAELRKVIERLESGAGALPAPATHGEPKKGSGTNGNGSTHVTNGNGNGARPYEAAGIPAPPVKVPADVAFVEIVRLVADGLKAAGEQWSDAARQDAVSTIYIQAARDGFLAMWTRGAK